MQKSRQTISRKLIPSEYDEQVAVIQWADLHPVAFQLYAISNGARVSIGQAVKLKKAGLRKGFPDLGLDVARGKFHGLRMEMKRRKGGRLDEDQIAWQMLLTAAGYKCVVVRGAEEAIVAINEYLKLK
jgi:hypothetical protein